MNFFSAIGFGQPWLLWGLAACSIPILLNLLNRQRFQKIPWAAIKFLVVALEKNRRKLKMENLLLLLLRILIIAFLVLALSQPFLKSSHPFLTVLSSRSNVIIVVDNSYSMGSTWGNKTYFDRAKEIARKIIEKREVGDGVALVVVGQDSVVKSEPRVIDKEGKAKQLLLSMINELELSDYPSDYSALFPKLLHLVQKFKDTPSLENTEYVKKVYFITDNQRWGWRKVNVSDYTQAFQKEQVLFTVRNLGKKQANLTITDFGLPQESARLYLPFRFHLKIKNYGEQDIKRAFVTLSVIEAEKGSPKKSGKVQWTTTTVPFSILSREEKIIPLPKMILKEKGVYRAKAEIKREDALEKDGLFRDNIRYCVFELKDNIQVLLLDGEPGEPSETDFLKLALNPHFLESKKLPTLFAPTIKKEFPLKNLDQWDGLLLANFVQLSARQVEKLENYVSQGGGLLIFLGENFSQKKTFFDSKKGKQEVFSAVERYNDLLYREGRGLLPARISWVYRKIYANLNPTNYEHPIFQFFLNYKDRITSPRFQKYAALSPAPKAGILATFSDEENTPAIVEKAFGKGKVILMNFSADRDWTNFPVTQAYLIFIRHTMTYLAREKKGADNFEVGAEISFPLRKGFELNLISPSGEEISNPLTRKDEKVYLNPEVVNRMGIYESEWKIGIRVQEKKYFALNLDPREGDLDTLSQEETEKKLEGLVIQYREEETEVEKDQAQEKALPSNQLWKEFLILALICLFLEMWLAYWFGSKRR